MLGWRLAQLLMSIVEPVKVVDSREGCETLGDSNEMRYHSMRKLSLSGRHVDRYTRDEGDRVGDRSECSPITKSILSAPNSCILQTFDPKALHTVPSMLLISTCLSESGSGMRRPHSVPYCLTMTKSGHKP